MSKPSRLGSTARLARFFRTYFSLKKIFTKEDRQFRLNWRQGLCIAAISMAICWLLDLVGIFDLSRPILATIGSLVIVIRLRWRLRVHLWFWATLIVYLALSAFLTFALTWSTEGPSRPIIGGFMVISVYSLFVVLHALELWSNRNSLDRSKRSRSVQV